MIEPFEIEEPQYRHPSIIFRRKYRIRLICATLLGVLAVFVLALRVVYFDFLSIAGEQY